MKACDNRGCCQEDRITEMMISSVKARCLSSGSVPTCKKHSLFLSRICWDLFIIYLLIDNSKYIYQICNQFTPEVTLLIHEEAARILPVRERDNSVPGLSRIWKTGPNRVRSMSYRPVPQRSRAYWATELEDLSASPKKKTSSEEAKKVNP